MEMVIFKKIFNRTETYVILIALLFGVAVEAVSGQFFSNTGMVNLARASMVYLVFGLTEMLSLTCAGPDVSYPALASLSAFITASIFGGDSYSGNIVVPILFCMVIGAFGGMINGFIMAKFNFPSLIVTLGTSSVFSGIMYGPLKASNTVLHGTLAEFGKAKLFSVTNAGSGLKAELPLQFLIVIVLYLIVFFLLRYTMFGRGLYAIGSDKVAAERSGFKTAQITFLSYTLGGVIAAIGGFMYTCNVGAISPSDLMGGEMLIIAACTLGGIRPGAGLGGLFNVIIGVVLLIMIQNNLLMLGIPLYYQDVFTGAIILIGTVVSVNSLRSRSGIKRID